MSAATIPYHLRQNKAIERALFFDLLHRIGRYPGFNISSYRYIGFGGPFMEDFRQIHGALRISRMTCIEKNAEVVARQKFNNPTAGIDFYLGVSGDYITTFERREPSIVWLDYTNSEARKQLKELADLLGKLQHGDIFKITLNGQPNNLETELFAPGDPEQQGNRKQEYERRMGDLAPQGLHPSDFTLEGYPAVLLGSAKRAVSPVFLRSTLSAVPLSSFAYKDGQQMFTLTGIVLNKTEVDEFLEHTRLLDWPFEAVEWKSPQRIQVPDLSIKERQSLESLLPIADEHQLRGALGFHIHDKEANSLELLGSLRKFYRFMPQYGRVAF